MPPMAVYKAMFDGNKSSGLVQFRDFNGKQLIYFTALQTMRCRIKEVRVSFNSTALDQRMVLLPCNPQNPFAMPPDVQLNQLALSLPLGTASLTAVQVVWQDESVSPIVLYSPCENVGEQSCAVLRKQ